MNSREKLTVSLEKAKVLEDLAISARSQAKSKEKLKKRFEEDKENKNHKRIEKYLAAARDKFKESEDYFLQAFNVLKPEYERIITDSRANPEDEQIVEKLVEILGSRGGVLVRLASLVEKDGTDIGSAYHTHMFDALESYRKGAKLEDKFQFETSYNRLNKIKYDLIIGEHRLDDIKTDLDNLRSVLKKARERIDKKVEDVNEALKEKENKLATSFADMDSAKTEQLRSQIKHLKKKHEELTDESIWVYADEGDILTMLGFKDAAEENYSYFIKNAGYNPPFRTLEVLQQIRNNLSRKEDADIYRLDRAIGFLSKKLNQN